MRLGVGLYGGNGHQIHELLAAHPRAKLVATAGFDLDRLPARLRADQSVRYYDTLDDLLADHRVELVSLCSPRRADQAGDAVSCLRAGRAVYAEKPAALSEDDLDRILATATETGRPFREMADTAFQQPYWAVRQALRAGVIGRVVQVHAQKSYPYHDKRPLDDDVDGGLIRWAGVHAVRMIEHVAGQQVRDIADARISQADIGGHRPTVAGALSLTLASGGLATVVVNYLNPPGSGVWGDDRLRVFGTDGTIDIAAGRATRLVVGATGHRQLDTTDPVIAHFDHYLAELLDGRPMPMTLDEELRPTRIVIRAHRRAVRADHSQSRCSTS